jgi:hypothetical protein
VLLTRSPLSPGPKPWFSLDLHVLSAPPAFVLSQDQTLREDWFAGKPAILFTLSLCSKVASVTVKPTERRRVPFVPPRARYPERSRTFTLLSFQGPALLSGRAKKPLTRSCRGFRVESESAIRLRPKASKLSRVQGLDYAVRLDSPGTIARFRRDGNGRNGAFPPGASRLRAGHARCPAPSPPCRRA